MVQSLCWTKRLGAKYHMTLNDLYRLVDLKAGICIDHGNKTLLVLVAGGEYDPRGWRSWWHYMI